MHISGWEKWMFQIATLPKITFLDSKSERTLDLSQCSGQIHSIAEMVSELAPASSTVGLVFRTSPELVLGWLGVLAAGRVPLMLQYPTEKMSKAYWLDSVRDTVSKCSVSALLCSPELSTYAPDKLARSAFLDYAKIAGKTDAKLTFQAKGDILQLSSGTTGSKKPIRFSFDALLKHTSLYNEVLHLGSSDCIVSWLPLYHDMGFIACFVMPLLLGLPIVLIDPITWVHRPRLLCEAIQRHRGSICYMPNFGFEVMAKAGKSGPFPTMRHWISCSEATYPATLERFVEETGADPATISTCYGMAENVFAVTQSVGMRTIERSGRRFISCGCPIPGTEIKELSGELFVRSPYSLEVYEGGEDIRDNQGFYPTGDLGFIENGEVVVTGRKQDLTNIGGRKFLLNDLDFALGRLFPDSAGRIASLATFDALIGTEKALFLIERADFLEWEHSPESARLIRETTGVEWLEVHFVPPLFITKTSSGKINRRKTLEDWRACQSDFRLAPGMRGKAKIDVELAKYFPGIPQDQPVNEELDSLGQLVLRLFCEEHAIEYAPDLTLEDIAASSEKVAEPSATKIFSIVALVDGSRLGLGASHPFIDDEFLNSISEAVGCAVHLEQIAVPPGPILYSDLIFHDYFLPRNPDPAYAAVSSVLQKIKKASLVLVDDEDNFRLPSVCAYPVLDHQFAMNPDAELLGHRMQRYTQNHNFLPRFFILGRDIKPETINPSLKKIENYLGVPVLKMAFHASYRTYTEQWDFRDYRAFVSDAEKTQDPEWVERFRDVLLEFIRQREGKFQKREGEPVNRLILEEMPHFCSFLLNRSAVDFVTLQYNSFCIVGLPSSLPYLQRRLEELGKPYFFSSQLTPARKDYECMILTGGTAKMPTTNKPVFDFMHAREEYFGGGRPHNVSAEVDSLCPPLAACNEQLFRAVREKHGVFIGNFLLNNTNDPVAAPVRPLLDQYRRSKVGLFMNDFGELGHFRAANAAFTRPRPDEQRVIFLGDSLTDCWNLDRYFPGKRHINRGISGHTTSQIVLRFRQDVLDLHPHVVIILAGTNDIAGNTGPISVADIQRNYATLSELAHAHGIVTVFASIPPVTGAVPEFLECRPLGQILALNAWLKEYCAAVGDIYVDYFGAMADQSGLLRHELSADGLHPNDAGYQIMAPLAANAIEVALKRRREIARLA
jgi:acyl-CoA synthetase (AMP-forming)/AMP-acid ligase II/lysophospholipase L1-like esterase